MEEQLLVTLQLRFPMCDRAALAAVLAPVMEAAVAAGGLSTNVSVQSYEYEED